MLTGCPVLTWAGEATWATYCMVHQVGGGRGASVAAPVVQSVCSLLTCAPGSEQYR